MSQDVINVGVIDDVQISGSDVNIVANMMGGLTKLIYVGKNIVKDDLVMVANIAIKVTNDVQASTFLVKCKNVIADTTKQYVVAFATIQIVIAFTAIQMVVAIIAK